MPEYAAVLLVVLTAICVVLLSTSVLLAFACHALYMRNIRLVSELMQGYTRLAVQIAELMAKNSEALNGVTMALANLARTRSDRGRTESQHRTDGGIGGL